MPQKKKKKDSPTPEQVREWEQDFLGISRQERETGVLTQEHKDMLASYDSSLNNLRGGAIDFMDRRAKKGLGTYNVDNHVAIKDFKAKGGGWDVLREQYRVEKTQELKQIPLSEIRVQSENRYTTAVGRKILDKNILAEYKYEYGVRQVKKETKSGGVHAYQQRYIKKKTFIGLVVSEKAEDLFKGLDTKRLSKEASRRLKRLEQSRKL